MKALVKKDATLTVKAGQIVEISDEQFALAEKLGLVEFVPEKTETKKKGSAK